MFSFRREEACCSSEWQLVDDKGNYQEKGTSPVWLEMCMYDETKK